MSFLFCQPFAKRSPGVQTGVPSRGRARQLQPRFCPLAFHATPGPLWAIVKAHFLLATLTL